MPGTKVAYDFSNKSLLVVGNMKSHFVTLLGVVVCSNEILLSKYLPISYKIEFGNRCQSHQYLHNVMKLKIYFGRV